MRIRFLVCSLFVVASLAEAADAAVLLIDPGSSVTHDLTAEVDLEAVFLGVTSQDTLMDSTSVTSVANTGSGTVDMTWEPAISKLTISSLTFSVDTTGSLSDTGTLFALPVGLSYSAETISLTLQAPVEVTLAAAGAGVFTFPPTNLPLGVSATGTGQLSLADLGVPAPLNMGGNVNPAASGTLVVNGSSGTLALSFIEPGPLDAPFSGSDSASGVDFSWNGVFRMTNVSASLQASDLIEPCGNGIVDPSETCDDSGTTPGDGCDATCQIEPGWSCSGAPSVCENVSVPALTPIALITLAALLLGAGAALVLGRPRFLG